MPFLVLFPGAVWIGVSADGLFAGVTAAGVVLLARGLTRGAAGLGGALLVSRSTCPTGWCCWPLVLAVAVVVRADGGRSCWAVWAAAVVAAFTAAGFWWLDGYHLVGAVLPGRGSDRPYAYWVWADLAVLVVAAGPAAARSSAVRSSAGHPRADGRPPGDRVLRR